LDYADCKKSKTKGKENKICRKTKKVLLLPTEKMAL